MKKLILSLKWMVMIGPWPSSPEVMTWYWQSFCSRCKLPSKETLPESFWPNVHLQPCSTRKMPQPKKCHSYPLQKVPSQHKMLNEPKKRPTNIRRGVWRAQKEFGTFGWKSGEEQHESGHLLARAEFFGLMSTSVCFACIMHSLAAGLLIAEVQKFNAWNIRLTDNPLKDICLGFAVFTPSEQILMSENYGTGPCLAIWLNCVIWSCNQNMEQSNEDQSKKCGTGLTGHWIA